jgi:hypothetical protein
MGSSYCSHLDWLRREQAVNVLVSIMIRIFGDFSSCDSNINFGEVLGRCHTWAQATREKNCRNIKNNLSQLPTSAQSDQMMI